VRGECALGCYAGRDSRRGVSEGYKKGVTLGEKLGATVVTQRSAQHGSMGAED
jgi:hypothetical protein